LDLAACRSASSCATSRRASSGAGSDDMRRPGHIPA
jgi:hypothetical protein